MEDNTNKLKKICREKHFQKALGRKKPHNDTAQKEKKNK